jgi:hypothetical protein
VSELAGGPLRRVITCHLSRDCNSPELSATTMRMHLAEVGFEPEIFCAAQGEISPRFSVGAV